MYNQYLMLNPKVELTDGSLEEAFTYYMILPEEEDKRPSWVYKDVILRGAEEHNLPEHYVAFLKQIEDNGYKGDVNIGLSLQERSKIPD